MSGASSVLFPARIEAAAPARGRDELARLRERVEVLEEENRQLREALAPEFAFPSAWFLTPTEGRVLAALLAAQGFRTKEQLLLAVYGFDADRVLPKIIDVFICKIRKKLALRGIVIETVWGRGFRLPPESRDAIQAAMADAMADAMAGRA